jgi:hypothetical protein
MNKRKAREDCAKVKYMVVVYCVGGVVNASGAAVNLQENILFLAGTWRFRLDPH